MNNRLKRLLHGQLGHSLQDQLGSVPRNQLEP